MRSVVVGSGAGGGHVWWWSVEPCEDLPASEFSFSEKPPQARGAVLVCSSSVSYDIYGDSEHLAQGKQFVHVNAAFAVPDPS